MEIKKTSGEKTQVLGVEKKLEFSIDTSNQMIVSILRDKLYSNKIAAVCREVSSNSRDANREAGKGDIPITISISNDNSILGDGELNVSFKDSGVGISPDRIENVFLKYGSSTKRNTNTQTGGFGIGAKTPFAYSKEFLVSTVSKHEGKLMKHIYQAIILNENGIESSQLILVGAENTTEQTGTEIIVPIQDTDRAEFEEEIVKATVLWETRPELFGFNNYSFPSLSNVIEGESWKLIKGNYRETLFSTSFREVLLEIDGIPYNFDYKKIGNIAPVMQQKISVSKINKTKKSYYYGSGFQNFVLSFKTGEISLSASREEIEYTKDNVNLISEKLFQMEEEIVQKCISSYETLNTDFERLLFYVSTVSSSSDKGELFSVYRDMDMASELKGNYPEIKNFGLLYSSLIKTEFNYVGKQGDFRLGKKTIITDNTIDGSEIRNSIFVLKSKMERSNARKNITLKKMLGKHNKSGFIFIAITKELFENTHAEKLLKEIDSVIVNYSEVELSPIPKRTYERDSNAKKTDLNIGVIFARVPGISNYHEYAGEKIKFLKKEGVISNFETCSVEDRKVVIVPLNNYYDLNDLNKKNKNIDVIFNNEENNFTLEINKVINEESTLDYHSINKTLMIKLLHDYKYRVFAVKSGDVEKIKNDKSIIVGLKDAFKCLLKNKDFIDSINAYNEENYVSDLNLIKKDSSAYQEVFKDRLGKKYFSLSGIDLDKLKIYDKEISSKVTYFPNQLKKDYILLANNLSKRNNKFDKYLNQSHVEMMEEKIKLKYPIIHYIYEKIGTQTYNSYDTKNYDVSGKEGLDLLKDDLLKLINETLNKK
jgi:hypothetical protein